MSVDARQCPYYKKTDPSNSEALHSVAHIYPLHPGNASHSQLRECSSTLKEHTLLERLLVLEEASHSSALQCRLATYLTEAASHCLEVHHIQVTQKLWQSFNSYLCAYTVCAHAISLSQSFFLSKWCVEKETMSHPTLDTFVKGSDKLRGRLRLWIMSWFHGCISKIFVPIYYGSVQANCRSHNLKAAFYILNKTINWNRLDAGLSLLS